MKTLLASILLAFSLNAHAGYGRLIDCQQVSEGIMARWIGTYEYQGFMFQRVFSYNCPRSVSF